MPRVAQGGSASERVARGWRGFPYRAEISFSWRDDECPSSNGEIAIHSREAASFHHYEKLPLVFHRQR